MLLCSLWIVTWASNDYDFIIIDQVSFPIPILRLKFDKIMFYCHFPDKLLSTNRGSFIMRAYRYVLDYLEEITTGMAHIIVVNSGFTRGIFEKHFQLISLPPKKGVKKQDGMVYSRHCPEILYPPISEKTFLKSPNFKSTIEELLGRKISSTTTVLTSLNRYERKKNIGLAIQSYAEFVRLAKGKTNDSLLVIAGGWDARVAENVEHEQELRKIAKDNGVEGDVVFLKSISND